MDYQTYTLTWRGITIEARYCPNNYDVIAHLTLETTNPARAPLPMTDTGYRSHYHSIGTIERDYGGDVIAAVTAWLDETADTKAWRDHEENAKQGDLFA